MRRTVALFLLFLIWPAAVLASPLSLEDCLRLALKRHPRLKVAKETVFEARFREKVALKDFLPRLSTTYTYSHYRDRNTVVILNRDIPISSQDTYQWQVVLNQPVFHGLALWARHRLAALEVDISRAEELRARQELVYAVKEAYFQLLEARRRLEEVSLAVKRLKAHFDDAEAFYSQGLINRADLLQAKVAYMEGRHGLVRAQNAVRLARARLNILLQEDINHPLEIVDSLDQPVIFPSFKEALQRAQKRRPEVVSASLALEKARQGVRLAKSAYYPWVDLVATYQRQGNSPDLERNPYGLTENVIFMAEVRWRLFEWGKTGDEVAAALARLRKAEALRKEILDQIALEVKAAYLGLEEARERLKVTRAALEQAEENFRLHRERYREQLASSTEVLDAEHLLFKARINHLTALVELHLARARLSLAMGSGYPPQVESGPAIE